MTCITEKQTSDADLSMQSKSTSMEKQAKAYDASEVIDMSTDAQKPTWRSLVLIAGITLGLGALAGYLTQSDSNFYAELQKPAFAPPGWLFPVAWGLLYAAMAASVWLILRTGSRNRWVLMGLYCVQLAVNYLWPWLFFTLQALGLAFFWLMLLWLLALIMLYAFFQESRLAGWLLVPYQLWLTFAAVLNFSLARLNQ